jgi:hypothetical protein
MTSREVVYNDCYGGFSLSLEAQKLYIEYLGYKPKFHDGKCIWDKFYTCDEIPQFNPLDIGERHDPALVKTVKELGEKAGGDCAKLRITTVEGAYRIQEYDGMETVVESYGDWR